MKYVVVLVAVMLFLGGCVQLSRETGAPPAAVSPTVVFVPSDSSYLLSCISELQGMKQKDFERYFKEASTRIEQGDDKDILQFICLSLHRQAGDKLFQRGVKLFKSYVEEHPDASGDMQGLLVLFKRLEQVKASQWTDRKKLLDELDQLTAQIEDLQIQTSQDQERIEELQSQIDQLKNIESIIKNREH